MIPVIEERADELKRLCLHYGVRRLDLFGSAATGPYDPEESDLDFLVEFQPAMLSTPMRTPISACWRLSGGFSGGT